MSRAISLHIGVNLPHDGHAHGPLRCSEHSAWGMAGVASRAGYDAIHVLRGAAATRFAVHDALSSASKVLEHGDVLLVTFSGHGRRIRDDNGDDRGGFDQSWCLYDGTLLDDKLAGYWRLFEPGVRIVVVSESCYAGGMGRGDDEYEHAHPHSHSYAHLHEDPYEDAYEDAYENPYQNDPWPGSSAPPPRIQQVYEPVMRDGGALRYRGDEPDAVPAPVPVAMCVDQPTSDSREIHASVLLLAASSDGQQAEDGLFTRILLEEWNDGRFPGSYCELYWRLRERVMRAVSAVPCQVPQINMLGAYDPDFPLARAFKLDPNRAPGRYRG